MQQNTDGQQNTLNLTAICNLPDLRDTVKYEVQYNANVLYGNLCGLFFVILMARPRNSSELSPFSHQHKEQLL